MKQLLVGAMLIVTSMVGNAQQSAPAPAPETQPPAARPTPPAPAPAKPTVPLSAPAQPAQSVAPVPPEQPVAPPNLEPINVHYEIAVRDTGGPQPGTKTVSMTATLGQVSSVRATGTIAGRGSNPLNVDVWPQTIRDGKVQTRISIEYVPQSPGTAGPPPLSIRQTVFAWLGNRTKVVVSQATDPNSDRRLEIAATATIVR